jgi:hypothetical protein
MTAVESISRPVDASSATRTVSAQAQVEARRLGHHYLAPEHLLLGLLGDAEDPVEAEPYASERRERGLVGLPDRGPHAIRLLVEARGLTLEALRAAVRDELDRPA